MGDAGSEAAASFSLIFQPQYYLDYLTEVTASQEQFIRLPERPENPEFEQSVRSIDLNFGEQAITLNLGSMGPPLQALRDCRDNLLETWGLDPEIQNSLSSPVRIDPNTARRISRRYPRQAVRDEQSAFVPVRVIVEADGEPRSCTVQMPTPDPTFDETVCRGLDHSFEPALDAAGQPVVGIYTVSVYFLLGG